MPPLHACCDQYTKLDLKEILLLILKLKITRLVLGIKRVMVRFDKEHIIFSCTLNIFILIFITNTQ